MRVSIVNLNLVGQDAIGQNILQQLRFFLRNGDDVRIYTEHPPEGVAEDVIAHTEVVAPATLLGRRDAHFAASDLYIYHYPARYALLDSMRALPRGVVILTFHNVTPPEYWHAAAEDDPTADELAASLTGVQSLAGFADLIVTPSDFNARQLAAEHGVDADRIRLLPLAVPLTEFSPGPADPALRNRYGLTDKRVLLFVGRMAGNKRIDLLIDALAKLREQAPDAVLLLVGDAESNASFRSVAAAAQAQAAALGIADAVIFTGRVDDLPAHYRLADLYVTASLHEGFGVPLLEAMASGVPVIAADATAHPAVVADAGLLVEPGDAAALAQGAAQLLTDDARYGALVRRGLARAQTFSLDAYDHRWAEILHEVSQWLPAAAAGGAYPGPVTDGSGPPARRRQYIDVEMLGTLIDDDLRQLEGRANTMPRGYVVRSQLPLIGPLLAWFRRNLTSHLREPYVDPTFERQELFNWQVVQTLQSLSAQALHVPQLNAQTTADELAAAQAHIAALEQRLDNLAQELATLRAAQEVE